MSWWAQHWWPSSCAVTKVGEVNISWLFQTDDEAYSLRKRNRVGKRLGERAVAWKLEDAILAELKGAKVFLVVAETSFGGGDHVIRVVGMGRDVIDLDGNGFAAP